MLAANLCRLLLTLTTLGEGWMGHGHIIDMGRIKWFWDADPMVWDLFVNKKMLEFIKRKNSRKFESFQLRYFGI